MQANWISSKATCRHTSYLLLCLDVLKWSEVHNDKHFSPGGAELNSATSAFSEMNEHGLCGAWEVFMLRPIESLLLLQLGCMIKCHLCRHPHSPTHYPPTYLTVSLLLHLWVLFPLLSPSFFPLLPPCQLSHHFSPFHLSKCPDFPFSFSRCWLCLPFFTLSLFGCAFILMLLYNIHS